MEKERARGAEYRKKNKDLIKSRRIIHIKKKIETNPEFKLRQNISKRIRQAIDKKNVSYIKNVDFITCELKAHIESLFEPWMNWENYGRYNGEFNYGWDIDHIVPTSSASNEEEIYRLNHYTNLQPLCSKVNRDVKRHKVEY